jgi:hypothetical protein
MRTIRTQVKWSATEYSSPILLKDFFNNIGQLQPNAPVYLDDRIGSI